MPHNSLPKRGGFITTDEDLTVSNKRARLLNWVIGIIFAVGLIGSFGIIANNASIQKTQVHHGLPQNQR